MKENNEKKLFKVVVESFVIRNEEGIGLYRTSTREGAERKLNEFRECYGQPTLPFKPSITRERAIVEFANATLRAAATRQRRGRRFTKSIITTTSLKS